MSVLTSSGYGAVLVKHTGVMTPGHYLFTVDAIGVIPVWVDMLQATGAYLSHT